MTPDPRAERTLAVATRVAEALKQQGAESALIGAIAVAVHGFARDTQDLDMATNTDPFTTLSGVARALREEGLTVELNAPDATDPIGGVMTVLGDDFDDVQIVNFFNPLRPATNPGAEAVATATAGGLPGTPIRVVDLPHLVALKLFAGSFQDRHDVIELLIRNPVTARERIRQVCRKFGLEQGLDALLAELE